MYLTPRKLAICSKPTETRINVKIYCFFFFFALISIQDNLDKGVELIIYQGCISTVRVHGPFGCESTFETMIEKDNINANETSNKLHGCKNIIESELRKCEKIVIEEFLRFASSTFSQKNRTVILHHVGKIGRLIRESDTIQNIVIVCIFTIFPRRNVYLWSDKWTYGFSSIVRVVPRNECPNLINCGYLKYGEYNHTLSTISFSLPDTRARETFRKN